MAKYAPIYMSVYDGTDYTLPDLTLDNASFEEDSVEDTAIGTFTNIAAGEGDTSDSTLTLVDNASGAVKLDGFDLVVGSVVTADPGTFDITVREVNAYADNTPHDTTITITVTAAA